MDDNQLDMTMPKLKRQKAHNPSMDLNFRHSVFAPQVIINGSSSQEPLDFKGGIQDAPSSVHAEPATPQEPTHCCTKCQAVLTLLAQLCATLLEDLQEGCRVRPPA